MDHPFPDDAYELRALLLSGMDGLGLATMY